MKAWCGIFLVFALSRSCNNSTQNMPFDPSCSLVVAAVRETDPPIPGLDTYGGLWYSERRGAPDQAQWSGYDDFPPSGPDGNPPPLDVKSVDLPLSYGSHEVHVFLATHWGPQDTPSPVIYEVVQRADGTWTSWSQMSKLVATGRHDGPFGADLGTDAAFWRVSAAVVEGVLRVCAVAGLGHGGGPQLIEVNRFQNGWQPVWSDIELITGQARRGFVDVGCASVLNPATGKEELHVCGVSSDGRLWHAVETASMFTPFTDVTSAIPHSGKFTKVDCAGNKSQLHLVAVGDEGMAWYTIRIPGGWRPFENVYDAATDQSFFPIVSGNWEDVSIGFCNDYGVPPNGWNGRDMSQLNVLLTHYRSGGTETVFSLRNEMFFTIRSMTPVSWQRAASPKNWRPPVDISASFYASTGSIRRPGYENYRFAGYSIGSRPFRMKKP